MSARSVDAYLQHAQRFGTEGLLEAASKDLTEADYAELLRRLAGRPNVEGDGVAIRCATPGCLVVFVPARKGQRYHDAACRQRAKRVRAGYIPDSK
jgi:hypothetical protein